MRSLTQRQALACETASGPRCYCRCAGAFHGAWRGLPTFRQAPSEQIQDILAFVVELSEEDPHYVSNKQYQLRLPLSEVA